MNAAELLEQLNTLDEHERVEAKRGEDAAGHSLLETVCALANEPGLGGGHILVGVERDESALFPVYSVTGIRNLDKVTRDIASQVRSVFNRPVNVDIKPDTLDGKRVLVVFVPEAQAQEKPVFFQRKNLPSGAFRRVGSTDQRCTEDDLAVFYQGRQTETFDAQVVTDATMEDVSQEAVREYRKELQRANPDSEALSWPDFDLLRSIKAVRLHDGSLRPTIAGLLLFGTAPALRRCFPMVRVDYVRVPGTEWVPDPEQRFETIEIRDALFRLIRRSVSAVLDDLPKAFHLPEGELQREDVPRVPRKVIREAVVNAVMHRSYRAHGPVLMIRYANRLEIRNPGFSLKAVEHLGEPGSETRNAVVAGVLHETQYAETKGTGIRVMRQMMKDAGLLPPVFESDRGADSFVARYYFHHFLGPDDVAWLARFKNLDLSPEEARALVFLREQGAISNATFRDVSQVDTLSASRSLRRLRDAGVLEQREKGSATYYLPTVRFWGDAGQGKPLGGPVPSMGGAIPSMDEAIPSMGGEISSMAERNAEVLPDELKAAISGLGRRADPEQLRQVILDLCRIRPRPANELAKILGRHVKYVSHQHLAPLLRTGRIAYTIPGELKHPDQAYRTVPDRT